MRVNNWEQILTDYLSASQNIQFEWGKNDCCLWAAKFGDLILGTEISEQWRDLYHDQDGADLLMLERGFNNCSEIADFYLQKKPIKQAKRGDIILHYSGALGICDGRRSYFLAPNRGLSVVMTLQCQKAWEI